MHILIPLLIFVLFTSTAGFTQALAQQDTSQQAEAMTDAVLALSELTAFVNANVTFCAGAAPETADTVQQAADTWYTRSGLNVLNQIGAASPEMAATFRELEASLEGALLSTLQERSVGREAEWCMNVPALLQSPEWDVASSYAAELSHLREFITLATGSAPLPQAQSLQPVTSPTYAALTAAGVNPEAQLIQDEFRCYDEARTDYASPHLLVQITGPGQYLSSYGGGTFQLEDDDYNPDIEWLSGPLSEAGSALSFDEFGQSFYLNRVDIGEERFYFQCYQQGASEQRALTEFRLKTPQVGDYQCQDAGTGEVQTLSLSPGTYQIGGASGTYQVAELLENGSSSRLEWLTGPFADEVSYYSEEEDTGFRDFSISLSTGGAAYPGFVYSSSELALTCETVGEPVSFAVYGDETAPAAPDPGVAIDGFFYRYQYTARGMSGAFEPEFYRFFPDGYAFVGTPPPGDPAQIDCSRTLPNGAPFCSTYRLAANTLYLTDADGEVDDYSFALDNGVPVIDDEAMTTVTPNQTNALQGLYWANYFYQSGFCGAFSMCSSTYVEWNYDFQPDGTFTYFTSSQNLSSSDNALGSVNASAYGNSANTGTYTISPHSIELRFNNGKVERHFLFITGVDSFVMGEQLYTPKEEDDGL